MVEQSFTTIFAVSVFVLHFLLQRGQILFIQIALQKLAQLLRRYLQILLVILKNNSLVVLDEIVGENVSVHQGSATLAQDFDGLAQKLHFDPTHVVLLHFLHLVLYRSIQLVLELQALHMIDVTIAVMQVTLQSGAGSLLSITSCLGRGVVETITRIPGRSVRFPWSETYPTVFEFATLVLARHMVTTAVLLHRDMTLRAFLRISCDPVRRLAIVPAFLQPLPQNGAFYWVVPIVTARETKDEVALAHDWLSVRIIHFDSIRAIG